MGRYFKTIPVELNKDFIYEPPVDMMANVLKTVDSKRDVVEEYKDKLASQLKLEGMEGVDSQRASEIIKNYNTKIDDISKRLSEGNMNFGQIMGEVKNTGREVYQDFTMGEASKIAGNKALFDKQVAADVEKTKQSKGYATAQDVDNIINYNKNRFKGTNYKDAGNYNKLDYEDAAAYFDDMELSKDVGTGFLQDGESYNVDSTGNGYITTRSGERKGVDPKRVREYAQEVVANNTLRNQYLGQKERVGSLSKKDREKIDKDLVNSIVTKYSGYVTDSGRKITSDATQVARDASNSKDEENGVSIFSTQGGIKMSSPQMEIINKTSNDFVKSIASEYGLLPTKNKEGKLQYNYINVLKQLDALPQQKDKKAQAYLEGVKENLKKATANFKKEYSKAGYGDLAIWTGDTQATKKFQEEQNNKFNTVSLGTGSRYVNTIPMDKLSINGQPIMEYKKNTDGTYTKTNKPATNVTMYDLAKEPEKYGLPKKMFSSTSGIDINKLNKSYVEDSAVPAAYSNEDMSLNDYHFKFESGADVISSQSNWEKMGVEFINNKQKR